MNNLETFAARIEAADPDRFRAAQLADKSDRERLLWIYAFHLELAKVPERVSEPMIGDIRYQWWREAIDEIYAGGRVRAHDVTTPLTQVLREVDIPRLWVDRLIDGRNRDLDPTPFADIGEAREYCSQTSGTLMQIAARSLTEDFDTEFVKQVGQVWGLTGLCRAYGFYHDRMLANIEFDDLLCVTDESYQKIAKQKITPELMPATSYAAIVPKFLRKMKTSGFDPKSEAVVVSPFTKQITQFRAVMTGHL